MSRDWKRGLRNALLPVSLAVTSGLAVALAFPDTNIWPLAYVAYVPVLWATCDRSPGQAFGLGLLAGATANFVGFYWMVNLLHQFGHLPLALSLLIMFAGAAYQGLSIGAALALAGPLSRRLRWPLALVLPVLYTGFEALHPILFPWFLGNSQVRLLPLIQVCDLFGVSALTFWLMACNAVLFQLVRELRKGNLKEFRGRAWQVLSPPAALLVVLSMLLAYGSVRLGEYTVKEAQAPTLRVGVVEPEIGIFEEQRTHFPPEDPAIWLLHWNNLQLQWASESFKDDHVDLVVWPESTFFPALSSYVKRADFESVLLADRRVVVRRGNGSTESFTAPATMRAAASVGEHMTLLVGDQGTILRLSPAGLLREECPSQADLYGLRMGCRNSEELADTEYDPCLPLAVGDSGTVLARTMEGWVRIETDVSHRLRVVNGFGERDFVVAGDGLVARGRLEAGLVARRETPGTVWVASTRRGNTITVVARDGHLARISGDELDSIDLLPAPAGLQGTVTAAATRANGLLLATDQGLFAVRDGEAHAVVQRPANALSCEPGIGCLVLGPDGQVTSLAAAAGETAPAVPGATALAAIPFTRHYWWIPADARRLYQAELPPPTKQPYPVAVLADEQLPVRERNAVQRSFRAPLLFGATSGHLRNLEDPNSLDNTRYNSAFLVDEHGLVLGRYDKQYLLAFGEYIPFGDRFPILYEWSPASGRFVPGPRDSVVPFRGFNLGVLVCYEDIIPGYTNKVASAGAQALFNVTNDAWFGKTKEAEQHFVLAAFRAVEQRLPLLRATTTGISGLVSATGEILHMTDLQDAETFVVDVPMLESRTFYAAGGRFFGPLNFLLSLGLVGWFWWRRRKALQKAQ